MRRTSNHKRTKLVPPSAAGSLLSRFGCLTLFFTRLPAKRSGLAFPFLVLSFCLASSHWEAFPVPYIPYEAIAKSPDEPIGPDHRIRMQLCSDSGHLSFMRRRQTQAAR